MDRYSKYYNFSYSFVMGLLFIIFGIIIFIGKNAIYKDIVFLLVLILLVISLFNLFKFFMKRDTNQSLINSLFNLFSSLVLTFVPNISLGIIPFIFSIYLLIISISNLIMYIVLLINGVGKRIFCLFNFIIYLIVALPIMVSPVHNGNTFIICLSIYLILLGIRCIMDYIINIIPVKTKNSFKRKIRITMPKLFEALIPYSTLERINKNSDSYDYSIVKEKKSDIDVIVHVSDRGFNRAGHLDIHYKGKVYSYGNYDEGSRKYREFFGDGVLFVCNDLNKYINFCIDNSKKTIFLFGIRLTSSQDKVVSEKINELMNNVYEWDYKSDKKYNNGDSYAGRLYRKTKANFYKFKKGKYKTYFVLGNNCCYLVDDILGKSGMDILSLNGIVTPGTYYNYFNREINKKKSGIISRYIYNDKRRPMIEKKVRK